MSFLHELTRYLREVESGRRAAMAAVEEIDEASARNALLDALERRASMPGDSWEQAFDEWSHRIAGFANRLAYLLRESFAKDATSSELWELVAAGISAHIAGSPGARLSTVRQKELLRLARLAARSDLFSTPEERLHVALYAAEARAVAADGALTQFGRVFLRLVGRDAVRWMLHVEAVQSCGAADDWRLSRATAAAILSREIHWLERRMPQELREFLLSGHSWKTLRRLESLGLLEIREYPEDESTSYRATPIGIELLSEVANRPSAPMSIFAESIASDLSIKATADAGSPSRAFVEATATDATNRFARLVAHELRNKLVPSKIALDSLVSELGSGAVEATLARHQKLIDDGITRALGFVEGLVELSALSGSPSEPFELAPAVQDAAAEFRQLPAGELQLELDGPSLPPVLGHRQRAVLAIVNVIRNALQAAEGKAPAVRVWLRGTEGGVEVVVDDAGPGVPQHLRRAIFSGSGPIREGGTGLGLPIVREIIEGELKGTVSCEDSPLGGARFVLRIPIQGSEAP